MAQEALDLTWIEAGDGLVRGVRDRGIEIRDAYWHYDDEAEAWHLVLVAPQVVDRGTREIYEAVSAVLKDRVPPSPLESFDVRVQSPLDRLARAVDTFQQGHPAPLPTRVRSGLIGDEYVRGLYLYPRKKAS
jgi:hypothetical protein